MKNKRFLLLLIPLLLLGSIGIYLMSRSSNTEEPVPAETPTETVQEDPKFAEYRKIWKANHDINSDYVGEFFFDSGLINVSFVQATSVYRDDGTLYRFYTENGRLVTDPAGYTGNEVYIWTNWKTGEYDYNDEGGSVFMDYRNDLRDQNLIIYGHHFSVWNDSTRKKAFTPLELLLEEENYAANNTATIVLEDEVRHYELACVYEFDSTQDRFWDDMQFWRSEYDYNDYTGESEPGYYERYLENIKQEQFYDTGVELTTDDKTLTLQTCISGHTGELYEILVFKQTDVENY